MTRQLSGGTLVLLAGAVAIAGCGGDVKRGLAHEKPKSSAARSGAGG
jgi:hypothetical protein